MCCIYNTNTASFYLERPHFHFSKDLRSPGLKTSLPTPLILPLVQVYYDSTLCSSGY